MEDGIRTICLIADTHAQHKDLVIPPCDVLVHAGDYSQRSRRKDMVDFISWLKKQPARHKILVNGNHDHYFYRHPEEFRQLLGEDIILLENSSVRLEGVLFWGSPLCVPVVEGIYSKVERSEEDREEVFDLIPARVDVVVTHSPPFGILDRPKNHGHLGCRVLARRIGELKPAYHLFGHIHSAYGEREEEGTCYKNASLTNGAEELVREPILFDYKSKRHE